MISVHNQKIAVNWLENHKKQGNEVSRTNYQNYKKRTRLEIKSHPFFVVLLSFFI